MGFHRAHRELQVVGHFSVAPAQQQVIKYAPLGVGEALWFQGQRGLGPPPNRPSGFPAGQGL